MKSFSKAAALLICVMITQGCFLKAERDNANDPKSGSYSITASVTPGSGATIAGHEPITVIFTDSMDTASVEAGIGGDIIKANCKFTWSQTTYPDDTLTISLKDAATAAFWAKGSGKTLTIDGETLYGEVLSTVTVTFNIDYIVYVKTQADGGDDVTNLGTAGAPVATIQKGISLASVIYAGSTSKVYVAQGVYSEHSIGMVNGVSVYGGYSPTNWGVRDAAVYTTTIQDTRATVGSESPTAPNRVVYFPNSITDTANTVFDGFTIKLGAGGYNAGIFCQGNPTITNIIITGKTSATTGITEAYGISIIATSSLTVSAVISYNTIDPGYGSGSSDYTYGIYSSGANSTYQSNPQIDHNTIKGGHGNSSYGVYFINYSNSNVLNNAKIDCGGGGGAAFCININDNCHPDIEYNTFTNDTGLTGYVYGICEMSLTSEPAKVRNNHFDFSTLQSQLYYYNQNNGDTDIKNLNVHTVSTQEDSGNAHTLDYWGNY